MKTTLFALTLIFGTASFAKEYRYTPAACEVTNAQIASAMKRSLADFFNMQGLSFDAGSVQVADAAPALAPPLYALYKSVSFTVENTPLAFYTRTNNGHGVEKIQPGLMFKRGILEVYTRLGQLLKRECVLGIMDTYNVPFYDWRFTIYNTSTGIGLEDLTFDYTSTMGEDLTRLVRVPMQ